jgi:hypothetical protein
MLTAKFDDSRMTAMLMGIKHAVGARTLEPVINHEATKIFEGASKKTRQADRAKIITSAEREIAVRHNNFAQGGKIGKHARSVYPRISVSSKQGKVWMKEQSGGKWFIMEGPGRWKKAAAPSGAKWSNQRWARFKALEAQRRASLARQIPAFRKTMLRARGLARRSWWEVAHAAGLNFTVPAYVAKAQPVDCPLVSSDFRARIIKGPDSFAITYENALPYISYIGGGRAIQLAIEGRILYFEMILKKSTGGIMAAVASRYGGVVKA